MSDIWILLLIVFAVGFVAGWYGMFAKVSHELKKHGIEIGIKYD